MRRKTVNGFTLLHLLIVLAIILVGGLLLPWFLGKSDRLATENKLNQRQTALTYGLAGGLQPVPLQDGWYYFRETPSSNIVSAIISFMQNESTRSNHLALAVMCRASRDNATVKIIDEQLSRLAIRAGLTNGYFALFQGMKEVEPHQPIEKP